MKLKILILALYSLLLFSCKEDFLNSKPNKNLLVPKSLLDLQKLLDNISIMNNSPSINTIASDEYIFEDNSLSRVDAIASTAYLWLHDNYQGVALSEWNQGYEQVFYSNVVLDALKTVETSKNLSLVNEIKGSALFYRGVAMYQLGQLFTKPYHQNNLNALGLPYPLESDVNLRPGRSTIKIMHEQILADLMQAVDVLPEASKTKNRPSKASAYAFLARINLTMHDYKNASLFSDKSMQYINTLYNFNTLQNTNRPFPDILPAGNIEVFYYQRRYGYAIYSLGAPTYDPSLLAMYDNNDLRKKILFFKQPTGRLQFVGYDGITTAEMYLIKAECLARKGSVMESMNILNQLCSTRFATGTYQPYAAKTIDEALPLIFAERRKEFFGRGLRWSDLRRLNLDPKFATTLKKVYNKVEYLLPPNSPAYVFKIPDSEIQTSGIEQN